MRKGAATAVAGAGLPRSRLAQAWPLVLLLALAGLFFAFHLQRFFSVRMLEHERVQLHRMVVVHPVLVAVAYVAVFGLFLMLSLPGGPALAALGGMLFGLVIGTLLVVVAAVWSFTLIFLTVRHALADRLAASHGVLFERLRREMAMNGVCYLLVLRLLPVLPFWLVSALPVLVGMPLLSAAFATAAGVVPPTVMFVSLGSALDRLLANGGRIELDQLFPLRMMLPLAGLSAACLLPVAWRHWTQRNKPSVPG